MAKKIKEFGYNATAVVSGKFFNCEDVYTLQEVMEMEGGIYEETDKKDDEELINTFKRDGFTFLGCVKLKQELINEFYDNNIYWDYAYMVRGKMFSNSKNRIYLIVDLWDEARGKGQCRAYRYNLLTAGSWDYSTANRIYKKVKAKK